MHPCSKSDLNLALEEGGGFSDMPKALNEKKRFNVARISSLYKQKSFHPKIFGKELEEKIRIES
jgi:hypothetical protein